MRKIIAIVIIIVFLLGILYPIEAQAARKPKSETTALLLSLGATVIPIGIGWKMGFENNLYLIGFGVIIGPSTGHFYAEQWGHGWKSAGLRAGIMAVPVALLTWADISQDLRKLGIGLLTLIPAAGSLAFLTIYDIGTAPSSVRKYNESIKKTGNVYLVPKIDVKEESYGLSLVYCF